MSDENQIIEDVEEVDLVENQELVQDIPEEVAEETSKTLTQAVVDALLSEVKKEESEEESDDDDSEEEMEEAKKAKTEEEDPEEDDDSEEEMEEAKAKTEEEDPEEDDDDSEEEEEVEEAAEDSDEVKEVNLPDVKTKAGYLAASFDALKGMKKSQLVSAYKSVNVSEDEGEVEVPKTKADIINAMYGQLKAMKKDELMASYKAIQASYGDNEELETESYAEDLKILADSEQELTESFKAKVSTLFEGAVANRVVEIKESLEAQYENDLQEEVGYIRESLVTKIDDYLSYVVETWIEENQEFVDNKLRTEITENFMKALQGVFTEHYIEVPDSKVDLVDQLSDEVKSIEETLTAVEEKNISLSEELESLHREKILSEATADLASTQVAKLTSLIEEVDFVDADTFASKVAVIKEGFFSDSDSKEEEEVITESTDSTNVKTIVEGEIDPNSKLSNDMQRYISTLSRFK